MGVSRGQWGYAGYCNTAGMGDGGSNENLESLKNVYVFKKDVSNDKLSDTIGNK